MSFIIWYQIIFKEQPLSGAPGLPSVLTARLPFGPTFPLSVSNDVLSGKYILDADITLTMKSNGNVDTFTLKLLNLPSDIEKELRSKKDEGIKNKRPLLAEIYLGYFDDLSSRLTKKPVMRGAILDVQSKVNDQGLLETVIKGKELGGLKLQATKVNFQREQTTVGAVLEKIASDVGVSLVKGHGLETKTLNALTFNKKSGMVALLELSDMFNTPLLVRDEQIFIGHTVGKEALGVKLDANSNLISLERAQETLQGEFTMDSQDQKNQPAPADNAASSKNTVTLTTLGIPELRVGQLINVESEDSNGAVELMRIFEAIHSFSTSTGQGGYTCQFKALTANPGEKVNDIEKGVLGVAALIYKAAKAVQKQGPALDVGEVSVYVPGKQSDTKKRHRTTLNYAQSPRPEIVNPSVEAEVNKNPQLLNKPLLSPFAWHRCGLIVPVYEGMRALLAHNTNLSNDAIVAGFLWPEQPNYEPPENEQGDYWLCLPTELDASGTKLPQGKGANDLIDKSGLRVIEAKGLRIFIGNAELSDVGKRPQVPKDQTIVIEHESKTRIAIASDGAVNIETSSKDITLTNGSHSLKIGQDGVEIS